MNRMANIPKYFYFRVHANMKNIEIEDASDVDVVEVVRCRDCKWKDGAECVRFSDVRPFPYDYCSRGERRTDE